jgi:LacI family transcriptional regulator
VLNGSAHVAEPTRARVRAVARRLGYAPSPIARALSRGRTQTLEVVVPLVTRYFSVEVLRGVEEALATTDYALVIRTVEHAADRERIFHDGGLRGRADGLLVVSLTPTARLLRWLDREARPAVLVDAEHPGLASVAVDHAAGAAAATRHLLDLGHRRLALLDHPEDPFGPARPGARQRGFRAALAEAGQARRPDLERVTDATPEAGAAALTALLALPRPPSAVVAGSDAQAMGAVDAARRLGRRVPEDVAVVGYNDVELAPYLGLTTVHVPMRKMGQRGVELLLARLAAPDAPPARERLPTRLVVRQTSAAAGAGPAGAAAAAAAAAAGAEGG